MQERSLRKGENTPQNSTHLPKISISNNFDCEQRLKENSKHLKKKQFFTSLYLKFSFKEFLQYIH